MNFGQQKQRIRRFLRDPKARLWSDQFLLATFNNVQQEMANETEVLHEVRSLPVPPRFAWSYQNDWEWAFVNDKADTHYQCHQLFQQSGFVATQRWEIQHELGAGAAASDGTGVTHPWEAWTSEEPSLPTPWPLPRDFHAMTLLAYDWEPLTPLDKPHITSHDTQWKNRASEPIGYYRQDMSDNQFIPYPRPVSISWDDGPAISKAETFDWMFSYEWESDYIAAIGGVQSGDTTVYVTVTCEDTLSDACNGFVDDISVIGQSIGGERISNGTFDSDVSDWDEIETTVSWSASFGGCMRLASATPTAIAQQTLVLPADTYDFDIQIDSLSANDRIIVDIGTTSEGTEIASQNWNTTGLKEFSFSVSATETVTTEEQGFGNTFTFFNNETTDKCWYTYEWEDGYAGSDQYMRGMWLFERELTLDGQQGAITSIGAEVGSSGVITGGGLHNSEFGMTVDVVDDEDNFLIVYRQSPIKLETDAESSEWPEWAQKYIECGVLARSFRANTDGKIPSLARYWDMRYRAGLQVIEQYKGKRLTDRHFRLRTARQPIPRNRRHARLPDTFPRIR